MRDVGAKVLHYELELKTGQIFSVVRSEVQGSEPPKGTVNVISQTVGQQPISNWEKSYTTASQQLLIIQYTSTFLYATALFLPGWPAGCGYQHVGGNVTHFFPKNFVFSFSFEVIDSIS